MLGELLRRERERAGLRIARTAVLLGIKPAEYRRIEEGEAWPNWETLNRICRLFGWPQKFVGEPQR